MDEKETWYEVEWSYAGADDWYNATDPVYHDTQARATESAKKIKNEVFDARVIEVVHHRRVVEAL